MTEKTDEKPRRPAAILRKLSPDDPRNIHHPCHREQWLEIARAIGRMMAREQIAKDRKG